MIEDPPILTVHSGFARPDAAKVEKLKGVPTGVVVDCMDGSGAMHHAIKPVGNNPPDFVAVAVTCGCGPADNLAVFATLELLRPGDAIVAAADGYLGTATVGDLVAGMARNAGAVAIVTDGAVRDVPGIDGTGIACFAAAVSPNSPAKSGPGTAGLPIQVGGASVSSGDVLVGDCDGVVVVPAAMLDTVLERLPGIQAAESALEARVKGGLVMPEWTKELLAGPRTRRV